MTSAIRHVTKPRGVRYGTIGAKADNVRDDGYVIIRSRLCTFADGDVWLVALAGGFVGVIAPVMAATFQSFDVFDAIVELLPAE